MDVSQPTVPERAAPPRLLNRNFLLLWQGQTVSQLGNQAFAVAVMFWTMQATGSASIMGLLMTCATLPNILLAPFGGTFADRHSRIRIIIVCDLLSGIGVVALALTMMRTADPGIVIPLFFVIGTLGGVIRAFFVPAISSSLPDLVPPERLAAANSLNQFSGQTALLVGQAVGGVLYRLLGAPLLFLIDGITYLLSAASEAFIQAPPPPARPAEERQPLRQFGRETAEGFRWVWAHAGLRNFMLAVSFVNFLTAPMIVLFPFYVESSLGAGAAWYGFLLASISAGSVAGFVLAGTLRLAGRARVAAILAGLLADGVLFAILGGVQVPWAALGVAFGIGLAVGLVNIYMITSIQRATPNELRGRVMGLLATLSGGLMPLGMMLGGVAGDLTGKDTPLIFATCGALSVLCTLALATDPRAREFMAGG